MFVVVGVTGGIAAYKTVHLVRLLVKEGHEVHVVPTDDAVRFVGLPTWEAISRHPVTTSVHDDVARVRHVALGQSADLVIVAPATANTLAKMATGLADDLLGTTLLATTAPVVVAPAMHTEMWRHPATVANIATLRSRGVIMVGPADGELTGGDSGPGRMSEPEQIFEEALASVAIPTGDLTGVRAVVTAGGTREPIDPVRFIGNRSSGKQGVAVALSAAVRGADVVLIAAHVDDGVLAEASAHPRLTVLRAGTAIELRDAVTDAAPDADVIVMAAAVADYRVAEVSDAKLAKEAAAGPGITLHLIENDDILAGLVRARRDGQTVVGFAAETPGDGETLLDRGRRKAARKGADLLAVNHVGWSRGFESDDNEVVLLDAGGEVVADARGSKREVADALWDAVRKTRAKTK
ncbi:bifunctional phosphopantothenoylcysteine decarboxylase/phosphopantothenate--cysteine ligase CoaBC [Microbacterium gallinarum]|uniref:Coenzyme A biosynthesis bifunctional protein CoaBC n=1 Tax=Microbacterium gallinarum TaxID=2762209 RepID=A0ABR8WYG8_9MICO|nr:bifunctional phosphopantothenoylcysteine decarboxylase/phosphopantothenate--cysteine ligase CoaBC [Microbacterium gallinarum]MBD8022050.1 bifunctional phosphopantothenoylcysteine decarboxylase/phosphopantothenate--cysteine ligase CoaBC [Microbacterium gallinarum]